MLVRQLAAAIFGSSPADPLVGVRAAIDQLRSRESALEARRADVDRVRQLIAAADEAHATSKRADGIAAAVAKQHALHGAAEPLSAEDQRALQSAEAAASAARRAEFLAQGALAALDQLRADIEQLARDRDTAADDVRIAVTQVLLARAEPTLLELRATYEWYVQKYRSVCGLALLLAPRFRGIHQFRDYAESSETLERIVHDLAIPLPDADPALHETALDWNEFARQIRAEAEAPSDATTIQ